MTFITKI